MYNPMLDGDFYHNNDLTDNGQALNAVRFITVDYEAAARRNLGYIRENITARLKREEKENRDAAGN